MGMKVSESFYDRLKKLEDFRDTPYGDYGQKSIGYGTKYNGEKYPITKEYAEDRMRNHVNELEKSVSEKVRRPLSQGQFEAVVDYHYNMKSESRDKLDEYLNSNITDQEFASKIKQYNKACHYVNGVKVCDTLDGLTNRAIYRSNLFLNRVEHIDDTIPKGQVDPVAVQDNFIKNQQATVSGVAINDPNAIQDPLDDALSYLDSEKQQVQQGAELDNALAYLDSGNPKGSDIDVNKILDSQGLVDEETAAKQSLVNDIMDEFGIQENEASAVVETIGADEYRLQKDLGPLAALHPRLASWATDPHNREILKKYPEPVKRLQVLADSLSPARSDVSKAFSRSGNMLSRSLIWQQVAHGMISKDSAVKALKENDMAEIPSYTRDTQEGLREVEESTGRFGKSLTSVFMDKSESAKLAERAMKGEQIDIIGSIADIYKGYYDDTKEFVSSLSGWLYSIGSNPEAAAVKATEGAIPIATGMGAMPAASTIAGLSFVNPAAGLAVQGLGFMTSYASGYLMDYAGRMDELAQEYTDPKTGEVDYEKLLNDPDAFRMAKKEASIYGNIAGVGNIALGHASGKIFAEAGEQAAKLAGKEALKQGVKQVASSTGKAAAAAGIEGTSTSLSADIGTELIMGRTLDQQDMEKFVARALDAGVLGTLTGGFLGGAVVSGKTLANAKMIHGETVMSWGARKSRQVGEAVKATKAKELFSALRKSTDELKDNKKAVKSILESNLKSEDTIDNRVLSEDDAAGISRDAIESDNQSLDGKVRLAPSDIQKLVMEYGIDIDDVLTSFEPETSQKLREALQTDQSIAIDMYEFLQAANKVPELEDFARLGDNEFNAIEADAAINDVFDNPFKTGEEESIDIPKKPIKPSKKVEDAEPTVKETIVASEGRTVDETFSGPYDFEAATDMTFDPNNIDAKYPANSDSRKAYDTVRRTLKSSLKESIAAKNLDNTATDILADVQYRRILQRAESLGADPMTLVNDFKAATGKGKDLAGWVEPSRLVVFTKDATAKDVVHELSHSWLDEMASDYSKIKDIPFEEMSNRQREYFQAMESAAKLMELDNIESLYRLSEDDQGNLHERFALTAERYFLEGKFENNAIRHTMEKLRTYMATFIEYIGTMYDKIGTFKINPEVERMFEHILGVTEESQRMMGGLEADLSFDVELLGTKAPKVYEDLVNAKMEAVGERASKVAKKQFYEREKLIREHQNEVTTEAINEVDSRPEMQLRLVFTDLFTKYGNKKAEVRQSGGDDKTIQSPRISKESFNRLVGNADIADGLRKQIPREILEPKSSNKGIDHKDVMDAFGINSESEFTQMLLNMGRRDQMIDSLIKKKYEERFPAIKSDKDIRDYVQGELAYEGEKKLLRKQVDILYDNYLKSAKDLSALLISPAQAKNRKYIASIADSEVKATKLSEFSPKKLMSDFNRTSREAAKQFKSNRMVEATNAKMRSLIAIEGKTLADKYAKAIKRVERYKKSIVNKYRSMDKNYAPEIMRLGVGIIDAVQSGEPISKFDERALQEQGITNDASMNINAAIDVFNLTLGKEETGRNMTVRGALAFHDLIQSIQKQALASAVIEKEGKRAYISEIAENVVDEIETSVSPEYSLEDSNKLDGLWKGYRAAKDQLDKVYGSLYKSQKDWVSSELGSLVTKIKESQDISSIRKTDLRNKVTPKIVKVLENTYKKNSDMQRALAPILNMSKAFKLSEGLKHSMNNTIHAGDFFQGLKFDSAWDFITCELLMGSESGARRLLNGGTELVPGSLLKGMSFEDGVAKWGELRNKLISDGTLTKDHYDLISTIWKEFDAMHPEVKKVVRKTDGIEVGYVEGWKVNTPFGELDGGYFPLSSNFEPTVSLEPLGNSATNNTVLSDMYVAQRTGNLKTRYDNARPVNTDFNRLFLYFNSVSDIIHMREDLTNFSKVLSRPEVRESLEVKRPGGVNNLLSPWFKSVASQRYSDVDTSNSSRASKFVSQYLRKVTNMKLYFGNIGSAIVQPFGALSAIPYTGHLNMALAIKDVAGSFLAKDGFYSKIGEESNRIKQRRLQSIQQNITRGNDSPIDAVDWFSKIQSGAEEGTYMLIHPAQNIADALVYNAAKRKIYDDNPNATHKEAVRYAEHIVNVSQGDTNPTGLTRLQRGNELAKIFTMVTTFPLNMHNAMTTEALRNPTKVAQAKAYLQYGLYISVLPAAVSFIIGAGKGELSDAMVGTWDDKDDPEKARDKSYEWYYKRIGSDLLDTVLPLSGKALAFMEGEAPTPVAGLMKDVYTSIGAQADGLPDTTREIKASLRALNMFGIPMSMLATDLVAEDFIVETLMNEDVEDRAAERKEIMQDRSGQ